MNPDHPIIQKAQTESPGLFQKKAFIEGPEELSRFGIFIPGKESFPGGYLKLFPEDFIVEEIDGEGVVRTIDHENAISEDTDIPGEGDTIYATLVKCSATTFDAIRDLAKQLNVPEKNIGYAGMKDKHAITAQRISIKGTDPELIKKVRSPRYFLKDAVRGKGVIGMTNLQGNRFSIFVRMTPGDTISTMIEKRENFYNYFYLQRFGSPRFMNFQWGYDILTGNHEKAVKSVLFDTGVRELPFLTNLRTKAREVEAKTHNWKEVQEILEPAFDIMYIEKSMLGHLVAHPTDYRGALCTVPDQVQIWLYGLASLLFNEKISYVVQKDAHLSESLPFILSMDQQDIDTYREELRALGIYPPPFQNLRVMPFIRLAHRTTRTVETATDISAVGVPNGCLVSFNLPKGAYATTFLSHHINIAADALPDTLSRDRIDSKNMPIAPARAKTIEVFKTIKPEASNSAE